MSFLAGSMHMIQDQIVPIFDMHLFILLSRFTYLIPFFSAESQARFMQHLLPIVSIDSAGFIIGDMSLKEDSLIFLIINKISSL